MSQVNDALQRASKSDRNRPPEAGTQGRLKPVADSGGSSLGLWAGVVLALASAGWFSWHGWQASHLPASTKGAPVAAVAPVAPPPPGVDETEAPSSTTARASGPARPATAAATAWPADLKLMGIVYNKTKPLALINGQPLLVGEMIYGIRVTKIEHNRVLVQWNGQVKELRMK